MYATVPKKPIGLIVFLIWILSIITADSCIRSSRAVWEFFYTEGKARRKRGRFFENLSLFPRGIVYGKDLFFYVIKPEDDPSHSMTFAPTREGKTTTGVNTTVHSFRGGILCHDPKGEVYEACKHRRKRAIFFNPLDEDSMGFDLFHVFEENENQVACATEIANFLLIPDEKSEKYFIEAARDIFIAAILHYYNEGRSFIDTVWAVQNIKGNELKQILANSKTPEARTKINNYLEIEGNTWGSVISEMSRHISMYATDAQVIEVLSKKNTFTFSYLDEGDIFLISPAQGNIQLQRLYHLMMAQAMSAARKRKQGSKRPWLLEYDEFGSMPAIEGFAEDISKLASQNVCLNLILQSPAQAIDKYGEVKARIIMDNCRYKWIFGAYDPVSQKLFSEMVGTYVKARRSWNVNTDAQGELITSRSVTVSQERDYIIQPHEWENLNGDAILIKKGFIRVKRVHWESIWAYRKPSTNWLWKYIT